MSTTRTSPVLNQASSVTTWSSAPLLSTLTAIVLCGVVPALLWSFGEGGDKTALLTISVVVAIAGLRFAWIVGSRERHLHEMAVWLFVYIFLGVAPFVQLRSRFPGTTLNTDQSKAGEAAAIVLVGCVALLVGSKIAARKQPAQLAVVSSVNEQRVRVLAIVVLALAVYYISRLGVSNLFLARSDLSAVRAQSIGDDPIASILRAGTNMGLLIVFVSLMHVRRNRKLSGEPAPVLLPLVIVLTLFTCVNPISSARYVFGTVLLAVLASLGAYGTLRRFRLVALSSLVGIVALFPILDTFRRSLDASVQLENPLEAMTTGDFDAFAQIINTLEYTSTEGLAWGWQMLGVFFFWVPRSVWPGKPIDTGTLLGEFKGYNFTNLSAPMWSEMFINFGWIGLVVGMVLLGYFFRRLDTGTEARLRVSDIPPVLSCVIPFYLLIVLRGSLLQAMANLLVILLFSWFVTSGKLSTRAGVGN